MDSGCDEVPSFNDITADYDESFFEENTLMLVYVGANSGTYRFGVSSVFCAEKSFCIRKEISSRGIEYPAMKVMDMCLWQVAFEKGESASSDC